MPASEITGRIRGRAVPLARRQLGREKLKLGLAIVGVALAVALVGLLLALRAGINEQVTTYERNAGAQLYIAGAGTRNLFLADSVLPVSLGERLRRAAPGSEVAPITAQLEIVSLHDRKIATVLFGSDPAGLGGPWKMAEGRPPRAMGELTVDRVMAASHGIEVGDLVAVRGRSLRVVGLTDRTASWMTPILFATRAQTTALAGRPRTANFFLVRTRRPVGDVQRELAAAFPGLEVLTRERLADSDRQLMSQPFRAPLLVMVSVAFVIGVLVVGLTVYGFVSDRRRELGMLKAIGGRNRRLYRLVAAQALVIAALGLGVGVALQRLAGAAIAELAPKFLLVFEPRHLVLAAAGALVMALLGAWVPARLLARVDPAEVFR